MEVKPCSYFSTNYENLCGKQRDECSKSRCFGGCTVYSDFALTEASHNSEGSVGLKLQMSLAFGLSPTRSEMILNNKRNISVWSLGMIA